jgi:hypothetical protein
MPVQIVDDNPAARCSPHLAQHVDTFAISQVMKGKRADHCVKRTISKRKACPIAANRQGVLRPLQTHEIDVE